MEISELYNPIGVNRYGRHARTEVSWKSSQIFCSYMIRCSRTLNIYNAVFRILSMMERFAKIVNGQKPQTLFPKRSIYWDRIPISINLKLHIALKSRISWALCLQSNVLCAIYLSISLYNKFLLIKKDCDLTATLN